MSLEARLDDVEVKNLLRGLERDMPECLNECTVELGEATFAVSQRPGYVPVRKGTLKKSGYRRREGRARFVLGYAAPYAAPQEYGSRPHVIKPKTKRALHWVSGGESRFAKKVNHPGNPPKAYIRRAWYDVRDRAGTICKPVIERYIAKNGGK